LDGWTAESEGNAKDRGTARPRTRLDLERTTEVTQKGASHVFPLLDAFRRDLNKLDRALVGAKE